MNPIILSCIISILLSAYSQTTKENAFSIKNVSAVGERSAAFSDSLLNLSFIDTNGEKFLRFELEIDTPIAEVWKAIATEEGMKTWMVPVARLDLKTGGSVKTNYNSDAKAGDAGTITLGIISYIPNEMLIYKVNLNGAFPEKCRKEDINLQEIIQLKPIGNGKTKVISTMVGWGSGKEWDTTYSFFEKGNKWSYQQLINRFKNGPVKWD